jgi:hypothetical protein
MKRCFIFTKQGLIAADWDMHKKVRHSIVVERRTIKKINYENCISTCFLTLQ